MKVAIPALLSIVCGCASAAGARREVLAVLTAQANAWNKGDLDTFLDTYWRSPHTCFSSASFSGERDTFCGWEALRERYQKRYPDRASMGDLSFKQVEVTPLARDSAYVKGSWGVARKEETLWGDFTLILVKFPEGWKIIDDHTSQSPPVKHPST
jgi:ketosteroid isomerase-like protein